MSAAIRLIKKIIVEKSKNKNLRRVSSLILEKLNIFKPDDVSCTQCRIEANEMEEEDFVVRTFKLVRRLYPNESLVIMMN